jgi:hypothetical protein
VSGWSLTSTTATFSGKKTYPVFFLNEPKKDRLLFFQAREFRIILKEGKSFPARDGLRRPKGGMPFPSIPHSWRRHPDLNRGIAVLQTAALYSYHLEIAAFLIETIFAVVKIDGT